MATNKQVTEVMHAHRTYKKARRKYINRDTYIECEDPREILGIVEPTKDNKAYLVIAGPKGGSFRLYLPDHFWQAIKRDIIVGDGINNGGWKDGNFIEPEFYEADD
jgi:hypothetical protein